MSAKRERSNSLAIQACCASPADRDVRAPQTSARSRRDYLFKIDLLASVAVAFGDGVKPGALFIVADYVGE